MIQAGNRPGFALEPFAEFGSIGEVIRKDFDGDNAVQTCVPGAIHLTHPTRTYRGKDFIRAQASTNLDGHGLLLTWNGQSITLAKACRPVFY